MLSTESLAGPRALGEESLQMWDLNKRLEAYLARVKFLEEENEALRAEIRSSRGGPGGDARRAKLEQELRALRDALDRAVRDKCAAELARDNLCQEVQQVKSRCQKEQAAREEAKKRLALSRKELEEERRAQIWLKERAVQLQKEVEALLEVHEEEKAGLDQEIASFSRSLESFRCAPAAFQPVEVEDYSKRLSEIWKGAVETYKTEVSQLEGSLCQAKESLWKAVEDNQQSQLQLQHLERDLAGLRARKELLEESLAQQWQEQRGEAEKFQLAMEALEQEQQSLRAQIARVLEDRQQLMHLKMSLSLEVATYRTLLEAESARLQVPAGEFRLANGVRDLKLEVSKLVPASPETRRLLPRDCGSPSIFPGAEGRGQPAKAPGDTPAGKRQSPGAGELQKIGSVLRGTAGGTGAPACSTPNPSQAAKAAPPLSPEPPSPSPPGRGSSGAEGPAWPGGVKSQGVGDTPGGTGQPLAALPAPGLLYPARLVSEVLHDALKAMEDDAQPKEEPAWAPRDAGAPSPVFHTEAVPEGPGEEQEGSEGGDSPEEEERVEEVVLQALGVGQEDLGAWEEEEVPAVLSPRDPETEAQEGDRDLPGQTVSSWEKPEHEEDRTQTPSTEPSHPSEEEEEEEEEEERRPHGPCKENGDFQEEGADVPEEECPHREEEAARAVLAESHLVLLTKGHLGENFVDAEQERCEQQKMPVCETDLAAEQERGQELCPEQGVHEAIPAEEAWPGAEEDAVAGEDPGRVEDGEGEKGEASREVLGGEFQGVGQSPGVGEDPGPAGERGAGEGSEAGGGDSPERESRAPEHTQESSSVEEEEEQDEQKAGEDDGHGQEPCPEHTEGVWGPEEPDDTRSSSGELEREERGGTAPAELQEAQGADEGDARRQQSQQQPVPEAEAAAELAGHGQQRSVAQAEAAPAAAPEPGHGQEPAQAAGEPWEGQEEDEDEDGHTQDPAQAHADADDGHKEELNEVPEEPWEGQEDDDGHRQDPAQAPEEPWEGQEENEDEDGHTQDPAQAAEEPWEGQEEDEDGHTQELNEAPEELREQQEEDEDDDGHTQDPAQAHADADDGHEEELNEVPEEPWEQQEDDDGDDGHRQELNEAPEKPWEGQEDDDGHTQDPAQALKELREQQEDDDDGHTQEPAQAPEELWKGQDADADADDGHKEELNEAPEELWKGQDDDDDDGHTQDPAQAPGQPWEQQGDDDDGDGHTQDPAQAHADADDGHKEELNEAPEEPWEQQEEDDGHRQDPVQALKELREQQEDDDDGHRQDPAQAPEELWKVQDADADDGHRQELNEAPEEPWERQGDDDDDDGHRQDPAQAPGEPWEGQGDDEDDDGDDDDDGLSSELAALKQVPGDSVGSSEWALEELPTVGSGRSVELEDTLPDSTPLHLCEGVGAASPDPPGTQESSETAPVPDTAPQAEGWLEEGDKPPTPTVPQSPEEEAGEAVAEGAEEEEEGYFMVSAPSQEVSSVEEAEISEDFEEIKVEGSQDDVGAPGEASPVPEGKEHPEVLLGEADGNTEVPAGEAERPEDEDDTAELEEGPAVPGADPSCPGAPGAAAGGAGEPAQPPSGTEGSAAEPGEELHKTPELERGGTAGTTLPGCSLGLAGQQQQQEEEEEEEEEEEPSVALHGTAMASRLQAQAVPGETEQILGEKPSTEEETPDSDSREQLPEASPPQPGPAPGQGGFPEPIPEVLSAELPLDAVKDSDILEIVEQALEFTQELMGVAEGGQQAPGRVELSRDGGEDSSAGSSSEEEPTVREAEVEGVNGLRGRAGLEELPGFPEELLNGLGSTARAREPPTGSGETPPGPGGGAATLRAKLGAAPSPVPHT